MNDIYFIICLEFVKNMQLNYIRICLEISNVI